MPRKNGKPDNVDGAFNLREKEGRHASLMKNQPPNLLFDMILGGLTLRYRTV